MASEIPYEGVMKAFRALRRTEANVKSLDGRVTRIEKEGGGGGTEDSKAREALEDIAELISTTEGSGTGGKWTLADCSAVVKAIADKITEALACVALCLCLAGCFSQTPPLKAVGPHGYTHFEDVDPEAEFLGYDEIVALVRAQVAQELLDLQNNPAYVTNVNTKAFIGSGYYIRWDDENKQMDIYKADLGD